MAANDAHQNVGVRIILGEDSKVVVTDALGEELLRLERLLVAPLLKIPQEAKPGNVLLKLQLDPYRYSLRHAGTHLLVSELTQEAVWNALDEGRSFVAFDWIADSKGFDVWLEHQQTRHEIGSRLDWEFLKNKEDLKLVGQSPLKAKWKIYRTLAQSQGELVYEGDHHNLSWQIPGPGNYRVELWLELLNQPHCWILTSPFYIQP